MNQSLENFLNILNGMDDEGQYDMVISAARERGKIWECSLERTHIKLYNVEADGDTLESAADNWMLEADLSSVFGLEAVQ